MLQLKHITLAYLCLLTMHSHAQDTLRHTHYLSLGTRHNGICLGNSINYNGMRLNLWDTEIDEFNLDSAIGKVNGINSSLIAQNQQMNGIQIGIIASGSNKMNGIQIGGIGPSAKVANGIMVGGLGVGADRINGVGIAAINVNADTLNGFFAAFAVAPPNDINEVINGVAIGLVSVGAKKIKGITLAALCGSDEHYGLSIAVGNRTDKLHGLQIGLINYAGNNPKLLRWLPIINFHP